MEIKAIIFYLILVSQYATCQDIDVISGFYTSPNDVYEGMDIIIACQVNQDFIPATDTLLIFRETPTYMALARTNGLVYPAPPDVEYIGFHNNELRLRIVNIKLDESGKYACTPTRQDQDGNSRGIGRGVLMINVMNSSPPKGHLHCVINSNHLNFILNVGETLEISCSSEEGQPQVALQWATTGAITIPEPVIFDSAEESMILSSLTLEVKNTFDDIQFMCTRQSDIFPSTDESCTLGPFTLQDTTHVTHGIVTTNTTLIPEESDNQTAIVASTVAVIIILILLSVVIIIILIKLGKCPLYISQNSNKTKPKPAENVPIEMTSVNDGRYMENGGLDNPVPVEHFVANGGAEYALINKKITPQTGEDKNKYPNPPNYPRPPKAMDNEDGEQYANSSVVTSPRGLRNKDNAEHSKEDPTYGNTSDVAINLRQSSPPGLQDQNGGPLYVNSSDVTLSRRSAPSDILNDADQKQMYANSPTPIDGERLPPSYEQDENSEGPLYADASAAKNRMPQLAVAKTDSFHHPAPDISPPPPPQEETESHGDVGLAYAELDLGDGPLTISDGVSKPTNRDSVVYASIA